MPSLGRRIAALGLPTLIVMEGGYAVDALGANVAAFLDGLLASLRAAARQAEREQAADDRPTADAGLDVEPPLIVRG